MKINNLIINHNKSIKDSYKKIDKNKMGIIFITDNKNKIIGCASDGDIRTKLVNGVKLNDKISLCINKLLFCRFKCLQIKIGVYYETIFHRVFFSSLFNN